MTSGVGNPEVMLASYVRRVLEAVREVAAGEPLEPADGDAPEPGEEEPL
jgi:hypothetical protein